jgi:Restriction Enzyme Adenine Methylase Associated
MHQSKVTLMDLIRAGLVQPGQVLQFGRRANTQASVTSRGTVLFKGVEYITPSGAARAVIGSNENGWRKWRIKTENNRLMPLSELRNKVESPASLYLGSFLNVVMQCAPRPYLHRSRLMSAPGQQLAVIPTRVGHEPARARQAPNAEPVTDKVPLCAGVCHAGSSTDQLSNAWGHHAGRITGVADGPDPRRSDPAGPGTPV